MRFRVPLRASQEWLSRDTWPLLLLLLSVLVPTGLLLWFMNDAINRQAVASEQTALGAYRSQLRLIRARADMLWRPFAEPLALEASAGAEAATGMSIDRRFARLVVDQALDGALLFDADGRVVFPSLASGVRHSGAARELLALQRLSSRDPSRLANARRLAALVNDYDIRMPPAQRLFLMGELRTMAPEVDMPTESALRLSIAVLEAGPPEPQPGAFHQTQTSGIWALTSADRRAIGLYRTSRLQAMLDDTLGQVASPGVRFVTYAPDVGGDQEAIAAGPSLPGWQVSFVVLDRTLVAGRDRARLVTYLWVGFAGIATVALFGVLGGQAVRRQLRVARLKTDLTAAVSHELRAPLASVRVLVDGLLADAPFDPVKAREYLQLIAGEHARLSRVIENFLTFARLDRKHETFVLVPTDPSAVVAESVDAIRERLPTGCHIHVEVADGLPRIMADTDALGTAVANLLDNALKFTPEEKRIALRASADERDVIFAISDNGAGVPAGEQRRIFQRFYRVDQRLARETAGVGLGLSIVALVVRAHGGRIDVSSEPGVGTTFTLRFRAAIGGAR